MKNKIASEIFGFFLCCMPLLSQAAQFSFSGPIKQFNSVTPTYIADNFSGAGIWVTSSAAPSNPIRVSKSLQVAALSGIGANPGNNLQLDIILFTNTVSDFQDLEALSVNAPAITAADRVRSVNYSGSGNAWIIMGNSAGAITLNPDQMSIAASALVSQAPTTLTRGTVFVFNSTTGSFETVNVIQAITVDK